MQNPSAMLGFLLALSLGVNRLRMRLTKLFSPAY
jgi:hypothetical protein